MRDGGGLGIILGDLLPVSTFLQTYPVDGIPVSPQPHLFLALTQFYLECLEALHRRERS